MFVHSRIRHLTVVNHHAFTPVAMIPLFHHFDVLMEAFSLLVTHYTKIVRKIINITMDEVYFHTHIVPKYLEACNRLPTGSLQFLVSVLPRKLITTAPNAFHASSSADCIVLVKVSSFNSCPT